jgi:pyruvate dehydrogenase E2 component (dihydrolipoamide acetyltransferase)
MTETPTITIAMPRLGETMEQGTIANWLVEPGDTFKRGDPLLELETDKTLVEYPALGSGKLVETLVGQGDVVNVGAPIARIESDDVWDSVPEPDATADEPTSEQQQTPPSPAPPTTSGEGVRATPLARRMARQHEIAIEAVRGTGRRGRVQARDVESHLSQAAVTGSSTPIAALQRPAADALHPILFVHGFAGLGSNWTSLRGRLEKNGVSTTAPDMPGHGQNAAEVSLIEDLIDWLTDQLDGQDKPVHLVGHSLGAHVAAVASCLRADKVARLSLIAPAGCGPEINGAFVNGMAHARSSGELRHLLRLLGPKASQLPDDALGAMAKEMSKGRLAALADDMARDDRQCMDTIKAVADIAKHRPVTAVFGTADAIIPKHHIFNMPPPSGLPRRAHRAHAALGFAGLAGRHFVADHVMVGVKSLRGG